MQAAVPEAGAGVAVAAAAHAELQLVPPREVDRHGHVLRGRRAHDHRGPRHARAVVDSPQLVVPADVDDDDVNDDEGDNDLGPQQGTTSPMTRSCSRDSGALWWCPVSAVARLPQPSPATRARRPSMAAVSGGCDLAAVSSSRAAELRHCSITAASLQHHLMRRHCAQSPATNHFIPLGPGAELGGVQGACLRQEMAFQFFKIILFHFEISYWHIIMQFKDIRMHKNQNFTQCHPFVVVTLDFQNHKTFFKSM